jgi:ABC-2 type transport system permease protein
MVGVYGASPGGRPPRTPSFNGVLASITLRAVFGRKRALVFALPPLILILVTVALKAARPPGTPWPGRILGDFGFSVILPLTALIIGTSVLGAEIDEGSIVHLLATPVRRSSVIVTKFCVGALLTMAFVAVPELIAGIIASGGVGKLAFGLFVGALAGSVIYNAVFVMLSVLTTRAIAVGLLYVLIWEVVLGNFVSGARLLSVEQYSLGVANSIAHYSALNAGLTLSTALIMGVIVTAAALVLATRRLSEFSLKGDAV